MGVERYARPRDATEVPTIRDLVRAALDAGKTVRQLEIDSGGLVRFQTFQELSARPPKQFPKRIDTIIGVATALNVSESTVVLAYAAGLGIPVHAGSTFALRLPPGVDNIELPLQDAILQLMRSALSVGAGRGVVDERKHPFPEVFFGHTGDDGPGTPAEAPGEHRRQQGR